MQTSDSFWSLFQVSGINNNIFLYSTIEGFLVLSPTDSVFLYMGQVVVRTEKKIWFNSLNVDGFLDSLSLLSSNFTYPSLPPTRNFIELSLANTRTYGSMKTLGLISSVSGVRSMILFELFNSGGCFPEHWLVAGSTVSLSSCLDFRVTGEGVNLDM